MTHFNFVSHLPGSGFRVPQHDGESDAERLEQDAAAWRGLQQLMPHGERIYGAYRRPCCSGPGRPPDG